MASVSTAELALTVPGVRDHLLRVALTIPDSPVGWAWIQHGFSRDRRHLAGLAGALAARGIAGIRPTVASLSPWRSMHDVAFVTATALTVARAAEAGLVRTPTVRLERSLPWVGVGHSAGAAVIAQIASVLGSRGQPAQGLVLLDPVDTVGRLLEHALPGIRQLSLDVLQCPPSRCNRHGATCAWLRERTDARVFSMAGVSHADPERIPAELIAAAVPPAGRAVTWACGEGGTPERIVEMGTWAVDACTAALGSGRGSSHSHIPH